MRRVIRLLNPIVLMGFIYVVVLAVFLYYMLPVSLSSNEVVETAEDVLRENGIRTRIVHDSIIVSCDELTIPFQDHMRKFLSNPEPSETDIENMIEFRETNRIRVRLEPESDDHDKLEMIHGCTLDGAEIELSIVNKGDVILIKHSEHIQLTGGRDIVLSSGSEFIKLRHDDGNWILLDYKGSRVYYVSPAEDGEEARKDSDCSKELPCLFEEALEKVEIGDTIMFRYGDYRAITSSQ